MKTTQFNEAFVLESNSILEELTISFQTFGKLNDRKDNVIWVCHALTANSNVLDWWDGLFGSGHYFDPEKYFIICPNILGSCYGTTGPATPGKNNRPLLDKFPLITTRDMAGIHERLRITLGIRQIRVGIGASLGGQQLLEWSISSPDLFQNLILIATNAKHSPYGIAWNESQRWAIESDPEYGNGNVKGAANGLAIARSIAMLSYRTYGGYSASQTENSDDIPLQFRAQTYQRYQGRKLSDRFNAYSYVTLSKAMDSHNVGRQRSSIADALAKIKSRTLCVGIRGDLLFPTDEQRFIAKHISDSEFIQIDSEFGHDGFLIETAQLTDVIADFLDNGFRKHKLTRFKQISNSILYSN